MPSPSQSSHECNPHSRRDSLFWPGPWGKDSMLVLQHVVRRFETSVHKGGAQLFLGKNLSSVRETFGQHEQQGEVERSSPRRVSHWKRSCRHRTYQLFSNPESSKLARAINSAVRVCCEERVAITRAQILFLIVLSSVSFVLETMPALQNNLGMVVFEVIGRYRAAQPRNETCNRQ